MKCGHWFKKKKSRVWRPNFLNKVENKETLIMFLENQKKIDIILVNQKAPTLVETYERLV